ncbi:inorganic triphosphatase [Pollutimonas harenae]|uniref:CYTH domain-containing protein n=1 Tax=Pollutimonas harenae TaxID=657015 RepID=A0A853GP79_9BURK|nr:CYTH domain-containing protein [Pollutimonas harenae]NYT83987.1 CYTH domain-containing protein [Pollutimonas harenae]TEA73586.1 CYTH domain-containing protein [Pollutimonas harenae]
MLERELKLYVPPVGRAALEAELRNAGASTITLRARYFDTQDKQLAQAGMALRLRLEGDRWVQTIKAPGPDELTRIEINHPRTEPELDLSAYRNTALEPFFSELKQPLLLRYETDIQRLVLRQDESDCAVELAYDQGLIRSGSHELAVCELELEQIKGSADHLFALGRNWLARYQLMLDFRSKAERGSQLSRFAYPTDQHSDAMRPAEPARLFPPQPAKNITLTADMSLQQAYQLYINECLNQVVRNAMPLAASEDTQASADLRAAYAQHMRAGIRRLLSCHRLYTKRFHTPQTEPYIELRQYLAPCYRAEPAARALAASVPFQSCLLSVLEQLIAPA